MQSSLYEYFVPQLPSYFATIDWRSEQEVILQDIHQQLNILKCEIELQELTLTDGDLECPEVYG